MRFHREMYCPNYVPSVDEYTGIHKQNWKKPTDLHNVNSAVAQFRMFTYSLLPAHNIRSKRNRITSMATASRCDLQTFHLLSVNEKEAN